MALHRPELRRWVSCKERQARQGHIAKLVHADAARRHIQAVAPLPPKAECSSLCGKPYVKIITIFFVHRSESRQYCIPLIEPSAQSRKTLVLHMRALELRTGLRNTYFQFHDPQLICHYAEALLRHITLGEKQRRGTIALRSHAYEALLSWPEHHRSSFRLARSTSGSPRVFERLKGKTANKWVLGPSSFGLRY